MNNRAGSYSSYVWNVLEYVALFAIVLAHEFGHSLACRSVGGEADQIVLWPLGGVAYVNPPQRPGATLWSIAAGPLVNVVLFPITSALAWVHWPNADLNHLLKAVWYINLMLLCFNVLPVYPLDGGQMLRSILWFFIGPARSLMVASIIGFIGVGALVLGALAMHSIWLIILGAFMLMNCWSGLVQARRLAREAAAPPFTGLVCPGCGNPLPPVASATYGNASETADYQMITCPYCGKQYVLRP